MYIKKQIKDSLLYRLDDHIPCQSSFEYFFYFSRMLPRRYSHGPIKMINVTFLFSSPPLFFNDRLSNNDRIRFLGFIAGTMQHQWTADVQKQTKKIFFFFFTFFFFFSKNSRGPVQVSIVGPSYDSQPLILNPLAARIRLQTPIYRF